MWFGMFLGSAIGGMIPMLWHASVFSVASVVLSTLGGLAGIWAVYRLR